MSRQFMELWNLAKDLDMTFEDHYVKQDYMMKKKKYYMPQAIGYESKIKAHLERLEKNSGKTRQLNV